MPTYATSPLHPETVAEAMTVQAHGTDLHRSIIDGVVVIYNPNHPPAWLRAVVRAQDEDGNTTDALIVRASDEDGTPYLLEFEQGAAITGASHA